MNPLSLIKTNPIFFAIIGAIVLALGVYIGALKLMLGSAQGKVAKLQGENAQLVIINQDWQQSYDKLSLATTRCSQAVDALQLHAGQMQKRALEAIKKAEDIGKAARTAKNAAAARAESPSPGKTCSQGVQDAKNDLRGIK